MLGRWLVPACAALLVVLLAGCENDPLGRQPVSGTVMLNGAPIEKGNISFQPAEKGVTSSGTVITGGKYEMDRSRGLPPGKYRVMINAPKPGTGAEAAAGALPGDPLPPPQELVPPEWNTNSEQFVEVTESGPNEFNFDIKAKGK